MSFAVAVSEAEATADAAAAVADDLAAACEAEPLAAVVFFATAAHLDAMDTLAGTLAERLAPEVLLGGGAVSVIAGGQELEETPAVAAWAAPLAGAVPVRLTAGIGGERSPLEDLPPLGGEPRTLVLLADPFSFPADRLLAELAAERPEVRAVGGLASASATAGGNRLVLGGEVFDDGAVGLLLAPATDVETVVSQGCRPIGRPYAVTRGERNLIHELGGRPALERLQEIVEGLDAAERALVQRGLHVGIVVNEHKLDFGRGDFLVRGVLGLERQSRALAVGDIVETGTTVQFHVRDAASARDDLTGLMASQRAEGALLFTCNGRGRRLFEAAHHDASVVSGAIAPGAVAGMFCAGEIGPVGPRSYLHGFTASVALFGGAAGR
ncbi:MAG: hypothetical protein F4X37_09340 [Acidimicrobiia bacterium]|nr:hypothetical protein [Acidimicrobiia bacterium]